MQPWSFTCHAWFFDAGTGYPRWLIATARSFS